MASNTQADVIVIGGGPAGLTAAIFTARHGLKTVLVDSGDSIIRRNAHLENFPGFPAGVNARQLVDLMGEQADRAGADRHVGVVARVDPVASGFDVSTENGDTIRTDYVVAATKNEVGYLEHLEDVEIVERGKTFVATDERGRTGLDGIYAAGRVAEKPHQAIVCAGHGAEVAVTILEEDERPFYHDWVAPDGYFTDRGRDLPPGCEEITGAERSRREADSLTYMRSRFEEPHPDPQETHPSLVD